MYHRLKRGWNKHQVMFEAVFHTLLWLLFLSHAAVTNLRFNSSHSWSISKFLMEKNEEILRDFHFSSTLEYKV